MANRTKRERQQKKPFAFDFDALVMCEHGQEFNEWADEWLFPEVVNEAIKGEDAEKALTALNKATLMLVMKYFSYEGVVPKDHWTCRSEPDQHVCLWRIFHQTYRRLEALLHAKQPPYYYEPSLKAKGPEKLTVDLDTVLGWAR